MATNHALTIAFESWVGNALTSDLTLLTAGICLLCIYLLFVMVRAVRRLGRAENEPAQQSQTNETPVVENEAPRTQRPSIIADSSGTTSLELVLVFPIILFVSLLLVQSMMLMAGNMFVHHAAYWATRQAILEIPADYTNTGGLEANLISNNDNTDKYERIHLVAALRLTPVAGREDAGLGPAREVVDAVREHYAFYDKDEPAWIDSMLEPKVNYAFEHTEIEVLNTRINPVDPHDVIFERLPSDPFKFGVRDPITVRITHRLNLGIPMVSRIFSDGEHGGEGTGRYTEVSAQYTLTNEGVTVPLPEKPPIDRVTPNLPELPPGENENLNRTDPNG